MLLGGDRDSSTNRPSLFVHPRASSSLSLRRARTPVLVGERTDPGADAGLGTAQARAPRPLGARARKRERGTTRGSCESPSQGVARARALHTGKRAPHQELLLHHDGGRGRHGGRCAGCFGPRGCCVPVEAGGARASWSTEVSFSLVARSRGGLLSRAGSRWFRVVWGVRCLRARVRRVCVWVSEEQCCLSLFVLFVPPLPLKSAVSLPSQRTTLHQSTTASHCSLLLDRKHAWRTSFTHGRFEARSGGRG